MTRGAGCSAAMMYTHSGGTAVYTMTFTSERAAIARPKHIYPRFFRHGALGCG